MPRLCRRRDQLLEMLFDLREASHHFTTSFSVIASEEEPFCNPPVEGMKLCTNLSNDRFTLPAIPRPWIRGDCAHAPSYNYTGIKDS
jgi:hypothetical protein